MTSWRNRIIGDGVEAPEQLLANPKNFRRHPQFQQDALKGVLAEVGFVQRVIVNQRTGFVVDGHARVEIAMREGQPEIPVLYVDLTEEEEAKVLATLDPIGALATTDDAALRALLDEVTTDDQAVQALLDQLAAGIEGGEEPGTNGVTDDDATPEVRPDPISKSGDVWIMGHHRLMCGDSTRIENIEALMGGDVADVVVFDPPYEVEDLYRTAMPRKSAGQKLLVFWDFKRFAIAGHAAICAGWTPQYELVWDNVTSWYTPNRPLARHKAVGVFGDDPKWDFDSAIIRDGKQREAKQVWNTRGEYAYTPLDGAVHMRTVEAFPTTAESGGHAHSKPMPWIEALFNGVGGNVYLDLFGGSGSTMIACEKTGRRARLMELDPLYCDVIIRRWQEFTGNAAVLESDGRTFAEVEAGHVTSVE